MKRHSFFLAIASTLVLSACGGGGGGAGAGTTPVQTSTLTPITASNSGKAAANGYAANTMIGESSSPVTGVLTGVSMAGSGVNVVSPVVGLVKRSFGGGNVPLLSGVTVSEACSGGGTVTIDANLKNTQALSNGDSLAMTASNCVEDGITMNGRLTMTFSNVSGNIMSSTTGAATMDTSFSNFSVATGNESATINGDMKIAMTVASASSSSVTVSGKSLQASTQKAGAGTGNLTLSDYLLTANTSGTTTTSSASFAVSGNNSGLGQYSYTVKTLQPFVSIGTAMPGSGSLIVNGAASSVTVTALNASSVRLDYSEKGDGTVTQSTTLSWAAFIASS